MKRERKLLYRSFEENLSPAEEKYLEAALGKSAELRWEKSELQKMRTRLAGSSAMGFSPGFSDQVMRRIRQAVPVNGFEEFIESLFWSFKRLAVAAAIVVILLLSINWISQGRVSLGSALAIPQLTVDDTVNLDEFTEREAL